MSNSVVITAGGSGTRMSSKQKKQFMLLNGRELILRTLDNFVFHSLVDEIIIVLPQDELNAYEMLIRKEYPESKIKCTSGAATRQESVYNGLSIMSDDEGLVLIHDGVRPFIEKDEIELLINIAFESGAVIPATHVKNTIKFVDGEVISHTLERDKLVQVHTPQVFRKKLILDCHKKAKIDGLSNFTDDSGILEYYGFKVKYLICSDRNIKITNPIDLLIAEYIMKEGLND